MRSLVAGLWMTLVAAGLGCGHAAQGTPDAGDDGGRGDAAADARPATAIGIQTYFNDEPRNLDLVACQDGDGPWRALDGTGGAYGFETTTGRFGIARVCSTLGSLDWQVLVLRATVADATRFELPCVYRPMEGDDGRVEGTITGLTGSEGASIWVLGRWGRTTGGVTATNNTYSIRVPEGPHQVLVVRQTDRVPLQVVRRDEFQLAVNETVTFDVDFATEGVEFAPRAVTMAGVEAGEQPGFEAALRVWVGGRNQEVPWYLDNATAAMLPAGVLADGDLQQLEASVLGYSPSGPTYERGARLLVGAPQDTTLEPPSLPTPPEVWVSGYDPVRLSARFVLPEWAGAAGVGVSQSGRSISVSATRAWLAGAGEIALPDLSGLPGWNPLWDLQAGPEAYWEHRCDFSSDGRLLPARLPELAAGLSQKWTRVLGSLVP